MASSSSSSPLGETNETRNWLELPRDVTAMILHKVGAIEILESAQKVCTTWRSISKDPSMWRTIDMHNPGDLFSMPYSLEKMAMHAVDRSCGELIDINIEYFGTDELLQYITERTGQLRRLRLVCCYDVSDEGLSEAAKKLPLLEELIIIFGNITKEGLENVGRCCPRLKSLKYNDHGSLCFASDDEALAIAETMPGLHQLQLIGNKMTNRGLQTILHGCPHLESLDLRQCFKVYLGGALEKLCSERIKDLRRPHDSTDDYGFDTTVYDGFESCDDDSVVDDSVDDVFSYGGYSDYDDYTKLDEYYDLSDFDELFFGD
ncbi:F-box/LRR-repeat protein [Actinidia chinensis var. chinensis]|uniref:F-box/LRR-repeat protein n=1 Tax=Actinidia chinensis var. chinensis TaxID=1590841 RepID=A0A2R6PY91_ACTCC|nr:F-box/LRR-repeat protein [Actinidia chinensis var. chinensis]